MAQAIPLAGLVLGGVMGGVQTIQAADAAGSAKKQQDEVLAQMRKAELERKATAEKLRIRDQSSHLMRLRTGGLQRQGTILTSPLGVPSNRSLLPTLGG